MEQEEGPDAKGTRPFSVPPKYRPYNRPNAPSFSPNCSLENNENRFLRYSYTFIICSWIMKNETYFDALKTQAVFMQIRNFI